LPLLLLQGVLSRGLQHSSPLVLAGTLSLMQQALAALQQLLNPLEGLAAAAAAAAAAAGASGGSAQQRQQLQEHAGHVLLQHNMQLQQDYTCVLHQQQQQQQQQCTDVTPGVGVGLSQQQHQQQDASVLRAAAARWCQFLQQLRLSIRQRLPEVSVLVAAVTGLQRAAAAAAAQQQQLCDGPQAEWLLPQAVSVLAAYARWLPEAVADGHVDLCKLLLQGQGQVSVSTTLSANTLQLQTPPWFLTGSSQRFPQDHLLLPGMHL
jgi:hypothetical protein